MTDWRRTLNAVGNRVYYKAVCAGCGRTRLSPVFSTRDQFCNRECEDSYRSLKGET
jgi:hypothetical protein